MFGVKDLKGLTESVDKFILVMDRIAVTLERQEKAIRQYVEESSRAMRNMAELQKAAMADVETTETGGKRK